MTIASSSTTEFDACVFALAPSKDQCAAIRKVLAVEQAHGTTQAAWAANINTPGPQLMHDFNSSNSDYTPTMTAQGAVNMDWFNTLNLTPCVGPAYIRYGVEKSAWIAIRAAFKVAGSKLAPDVTNYIPYSDPSEVNAAVLTQHGTTYGSLFPPNWMAANCHK